MKANDLLLEFTGTEKYYRHTFGMKYTEGVAELAKQFSCFWFLDVIASWQIYPKVRNERFQSWKLIKKVNRFEVVATNGNYAQIAKQIIEHSDFPHEEAEVWVEDGIMLLPSEH